MWSRLILLALGCWLQFSPFIFQDGGASSPWWSVDAGCGLIVILLAAISLERPSSAAPPLLMLVGALLIGVAYTQFGNPSPVAQNRAVVGLLLMLLASVPPRGLRAQINRGSQGDSQGSSRRLPSLPGRVLGDSFTVYPCHSRPGGRRKAPRLRGRGDQPNSRL